MTTQHLQKHLQKERRLLFNKTKNYLQNSMWLL